MNHVAIKTRTISGLKIRTKNADEMNPKTAKIGALWQTFFTDAMPTLEPTPLYGVYTNYESDARGEFDVLVGVED